MLKEETKPEVVNKQLTKMNYTSLAIPDTSNKLAQLWTYHPKT